MIDPQYKIYWLKKPHCKFSWPVQTTEKGLPSTAYVCKHTIGPQGEELNVFGGPRLGKSRYSVIQSLFGLFSRKENTVIE